MKDIEQIKAETARQLADAFETRTRAPEAGGAEFVCLKDGAPQWVKDAVFAAHGNGSMLPDDWRYRMIREVADALTERDPEAWEDTGEIADQLADIYNATLTAWVASHLSRIGYVDEAVESGLVEPEAGLSRRLMVGQYLEYQEIAGALIATIEERAEEVDAEQDEDDEDATEYRPPNQLTRGLSTMGSIPFFSDEIALVPHSATRSGDLGRRVTLREFAAGGRLALYETDAGELYARTPAGDFIEGPEA